MPGAQRVGGGIRDSSAAQTPLGMTELGIRDQLGGGNEGCDAESAALTILRGRSSAATAARSLETSVPGAQPRTPEMPGAQRGGGGIRDSSAAQTPLGMTEWAISDWWGKPKPFRDDRKNRSLVQLPLVIRDLLHTR